MKRLVILLLLYPILSIGSASPQERVSYCDLVQNPGKLSGKEVTIRATYRYGFEWRELYCLGCMDQGKAWVEFSDNLDNTTERALKKMPKGAGIVNMTVEGVFYSGGHYGHENGYSHSFLVTRIGDVVVVSKGMKSASTEREIEKKWACGGEGVLIFV